MPKNYRATVASIHSAYGQRLRTADYRDLLNLHTVAEVVAYLKETPRYAELLQGLEPAFTHRGYLEMLLKRNLFTQCLHFCSMEQLRRAPFFRFFIYEYEIRELFQAIQLGQQGYISAMSTWLSPYLRFSLDDLARAALPEEIIAAVKHTPYAPILKRYLKKDGSPIPYTECEIALRGCYLEQILAEAKQTLKGDDLHALTGLIGEQIDLINLINAFRLKSVFHTDRDTLRTMLLPIDGKLPKRICSALYDAPDTEAFLQVLRTTRYGRLMQGIGQSITDTTEQMQIEHAFQQLRYRNARNALHFSGHAAVSLYAIHFLNQIEVQNLITIIEGIRYQKPVAYMQSLLILE